MAKATPLCNINHSYELYFTVTVSLSLGDFSHRPLGISLSCKPISRQSGCLQFDRFVIKMPYMLKIKIILLKNDYHVNQALKKHDLTCR